MLLVEVADCEGDLHSVEFRSLLSEPCRVAKVHEQLAAPNKPHDEENLGLSLEHVVHANKEWVICLHQDFLLEFGALNLVIV